jgi:hypothetical protein
MRKFYINMIFIDTNIYKKKWCRANPKEKEPPAYPKEAQVSQADWLKKQLKIGNQINAWNIVIGHDPFYTRSHKSDKIIRSDKEFLELIKDNADSIHLYMCADEHNQQYVRDLIVTDSGIFFNEHYDDGGNVIKLPPQIIAGSGGTKLDKSISDDKQLLSATKFYQAAFGFVSILIDEYHIQFQFNGVSSPQTHAKDSEVFIITKE